MLVQSFRNGNKEKLQIIDFGGLLNALPGYKVPYTPQQSGIYGIDAASGQWMLLQGIMIVVSQLFFAIARARGTLSCSVSTSSIFFSLWILCGYFQAR